MDKAPQASTGQNVSRRGFLKYAAAGAAAAGAAAVAGSAYYKYSYLPSQSPTSFGMGYTTSLGTYVTLTAAQQQNLFAKNKLAPDFIKFATPPPEIAAFVGNQFPLAWNADLTTANARAQGVGVQLVHPNSLATDVVLVRDNSPYQTIYDLKGKTVGEFELPAYDYIIPSELWNQNHPNQKIDPVNDFKISVGALNVLGRLLLTGQVEAIATFQPFAAQLVPQGARIISTTSEAWKTLTGHPLVVTFVAAQQSYAEKNPTIVKELIQTVKEAQSYVRNNPTFLDNFVKDTFNITDAATLDLLRKAEYNAWDYGSWDQSAISNLNDYLQLLLKNGAIKSMPTGLFTNAYNP